MVIIIWIYIFKALKSSVDSDVLEKSEKDRQEQETHQQMSLQEENADVDGLLKEREALIEQNEGNYL